MVEKIVKEGANCPHCNKKMESDEYERLCDICSSKTSEPKYNDVSVNIYSRFGLSIGYDWFDVCSFGCAFNKIKSLKIEDLEKGKLKLVIEKEHFPAFKKFMEKLEINEPNDQLNDPCKNNIKYACENCDLIKNCSIQIKGKINSINDQISGLNYGIEYETEKKMTDQSLINSYKAEMGKLKGEKDILQQKLN